MSDSLRQVEAWLEPRLTTVPNGLRRKISDAVANVDDGAPTAIAVFQAAAFDVLGETMKNPGASEAVSLLAADALITYMCEYCAEHEPESLANLL